MASKNRFRLSRQKGVAFEREIATALRSVFPDARRHLEYQEAEAAHGADLVNTGHYRVQCKRGRKWASLSCLKEVKADELLGEVPVLVTRGDAERALVALPLDEFVRLLRAAMRSSGGARSA